MEFLPTTLIYKNKDGTVFLKKKKKEQKVLYT